MPNGDRNNKIWDTIAEIKDDYLKSRTFWQVTLVLVGIVIGSMGVMWTNISRNAKAVQTNEVQQERIVTTLENIEDKIDNLERY